MPTPAVRAQRASLCTEDGWRPIGAVDVEPQARVITEDAQGCERINGAAVDGPRAGSHGNGDMAGCEILLYNGFEGVERHAALSIHQDDPQVVAAQAQECDRFPDTAMALGTRDVHRFDKRTAGSLKSFSPLRGIISQNRNFPRRGGTGTPYRVHSTMIGVGA